MLSFTMMAQYKVTGTVKDADEMPLPGVSVKVKGGTKGTTTDFDGKYSLNVTKGNVLEFTSVGFESVSKKMDGSAKIDVTMAAGLSLDEVVITGNRAKPRTVLNSPVPIDLALLNYKRVVKYK